MNLFILLIYIFSCSCVAAPPPKTLTKEWQEATNERAKEMNLNPITGMCPHSPEFFNLSNAGFFLFPLPGISSEGYSGKGFVQAKK